MREDLLHELRGYGLSYSDVSLIRNKDGVTVARVHCGEKTAILKFFENEVFRREIENYDILQRCGIPTIAVLGKSNRSLLLEDLESSGSYRLGRESDFEDTDVIRAIAGWYKTLHASGAGYVRQHGRGMYEEWDCFIRENIAAVRDRFGLAGLRGLDLLEENFALIRGRMDEAPRTLTYNDFYYTNLAVRKDGSEALMFDYNMLGKGCYVSDIRNVICWFSEENKNLFLSVYGEPDRDLMLLDEICSPVISLCSAMNRGIFPDWAKEAADDLARTPERFALLLNL